MDISVSNAGERLTGSRAALPPVSSSVQPHWWIPVPMSVGDRSPLVIDLCCGTGGWTDAFIERGCTCIGYDIHRDRRYRGHHVLADVRTLDGGAFRHALVIVMSPPCTDFSLANPKRRAPGWEPDMELMEACFRIGRQSGRPFIIENVYGAVKYLGAPSHHWGKFYLWGSGVPALLPKGPRWKDSWKKRYRSPALRARIPEELASAVAHFWCSITESAGRSPWE